MGLAEWFWKHYNGGVGKKLGRSPLRKRFSRYRRTRLAGKEGFENTYRPTRLARKEGFEPAKKIQDVEGVKPDTGYIIMVD